MNGVPIALLLTASLLLSCAGPASTHTSSVTLRRVPHGGIQPQALQDDKGRTHLLYFSGESAGGDLFYVTSDDDGATFSKPTQVNSVSRSAIAAGTIRGGQLALGTNARPHVSWNDTKGTQTFYTRMNAAGTAFEDQRGIMHRTVNLDGGGAIAADGAGNVYVAWHGNDAQGSSRDETGRLVWIATSKDEGGSFASERAAWTQPTGTCGCCGLALRAEAGAVNLLYRSATALIDRDIYFLSSSDEGRTFQGARIDRWPINACPVTGMSLARAGVRLLGAWETEGKVVIAELNSTTPGATNRFTPMVMSAPAKHPRIAVNARGESLLVWTEGTGWSRGGSVAWQMLDGDGRTVGPRGKAPGVPVWSFAAAVPRRDGGFVVYY